MRIYTPKSHSICRHQATFFRRLLYSFKNMKPILLISVVILLVTLDFGVANGVKSSRGDWLARKKYFPWKSRGECGSFSVVFGKRGQFPLRGLVGFQGSGNKWLRELIQSNTGYFISNVFRSNSHGSIYGYRARPWEGTTILTRTHDAGYRLSRQLQKAFYGPGGKRAYLEEISQLSYNYSGILLIRNPWEAIFSSWQHKKAGSYIKSIKITDLKDSAEYAEYFEKASNAWKAIAERWIENTPSVSTLLILKYEDVKTDPRVELEKVVKFLGLEPSNERLTCSTLNPHRRWIRKTSDEIRLELNNVYDIMAPLSQKLEEYILQINSSLEKRGFSTRLTYARPNSQEKVGGSI